MSSDLEEFLRQAAAMRQRKSVEQRAEAERQREQQARSRPPAYTNSRQERLVDAIVDEDEADVAGLEVHDHTQAHNSSSPSQRKRSVAATPPVKTDAPPASTASELRKMLSRPAGVRQAFLLREILNRPRF